GDLMSMVITVSRRHITRVGYNVRRVVGVVAVCSSALFRCGAGVQPSMTVVMKGAMRLLSVLINIKDLVARVIAVGGRRINTAGVPDHFFNRRQTAQRIFGVTSLPSMLVLQ